MSKEGEILKRDEFSFERLPQQYVREEETAYTLVEQRFILKDAVYDVLNRDDTEYQLLVPEDSLIICPFDMEIR